MFTKKKLIGAVILVMSIPLLIWAVLCLQGLERLDSIRDLDVAMRAGDPGEYAEYRLRDYVHLSYGKQSGEFRWSNEFYEFGNIEYDLIGSTFLSELSADSEYFCEGGLVETENWKWLHPFFPHKLMSISILEDFSKNLNARSTELVRIIDSHPELNKIKIPLSALSKELIDAVSRQEVIDVFTVFRSTDEEETALTKIQSENLNYVMSTLHNVNRIALKNMHIDTLEFSGLSRGIKNRLPVLYLEHLGCNESCVANAVKIAENGWVENLVISRWDINRGDLSKFLVTDQLKTLSLFQVVPYEWYEELDTVTTDLVWNVPHLHLQEGADGMEFFFQSLRPEAPQLRLSMSCEGRYKTGSELRAMGVDVVEVNDYWYGGIEPNHGYYDLIHN